MGAFRSALKLAERIDKAGNTVKKKYGKASSFVSGKATPITKYTKRFEEIPRWQRKAAKKSLKRVAGFGPRGKMTIHDSMDSLDRIKKRQGGVRDYLRVGASADKWMQHGRKQSGMLPPAEDYNSWPPEARSRLEKGQRSHARKQETQRAKGGKNGKTRTTTDSPGVNVRVQVLTHPRPRSRKRSLGTAKRTTKR